MNILDNIKTSKTYIGKSDMTSGDKFKIVITYNSKSCQMTFNDNYKNESDKNDFIYALLQDMRAYEYAYNLADFQSQFDYKDFKQAEKIYNACQRQARKVHKLFNEEEIEELEKLFENF